MIGNKINMIYFVASLPRTGTKSICKMANICGLKSMHVMGDSEKFISYVKNGYNFFADTPFYHPVFLLSAINMIQDMEIKIIYINRDIDGWCNSFNRLWDGWPNRPDIRNSSNIKVNFVDKLNYEYILQYEDIKDRFNIHKHSISEICKLYSIEMLSYKFDYGWGPFCEFIKCDIPNQNIPHLR